VPQIVRQLLRRSLLIQVVSVYLLFVTVVLVTGLVVNANVEQRLVAQVQTADQALAQEIAVDTSQKLQDAELSLQREGPIVLNAATPSAIRAAFQDYVVARTDVDHIYWLDPFGAIRVSTASPKLGGEPDRAGIGQEFGPPDVIQRAQTATSPVFEVGIAEETTFNAGVIVAEPVRDRAGVLAGIVVCSLSLVELSQPLASTVETQTRLDRSLQISVIDDQGRLIATPQHDRILQTVLNELPGADQALSGVATSRLGPGQDGKDWLFSAVPVKGTGWAVVVQRRADEALAVVAQFHVWLLTTAVIFAIGGLVFWMMLLSRVIRPLHALAAAHRAVPEPTQPASTDPLALTYREDEVGGLARSLARLERDVRAQLGELQTLLDTSNAVVQTLDPHEVGRTIIHEVGRLVDVQAAAVLVPDDTGVLHVLASEGRSATYADAVHVSSNDLAFPAPRALHDGRPVQMIANGTASFPPISYDEGFRAVLAIPIISRHVGGVVLLVHRTEPQPFSKDEVDLLLTFANYATLAWEHAVLYERSDERLREVAAENERLYRQTHEEKQRLAAIMGSMSDGLVLAGADGRVLYANPGVAALTGLSIESLTGGTIASVHKVLREATASGEDYDEARRRAEAGDDTGWTIEIESDGQRRAIALRLFDVSDEAGHTIGRGLLLRDVTREHEMDEFKTTLLAAVGHELRTPLTAIKGHASTLLQEDVTWSPQEQQRSLRTISAEVDRLTGLVRDLLDLSRQQAGVLPLHCEAWRIEGLLAGALQRLPQPLPGLAVDFPTDVPPVEVDRARIEVVLRNLLANALAYSSQDVRVAARTQGELVEIEVSNAGPGIAPDALPHLFERFFRTSSGVQRHSQGTGLGLAICKAFVEAHGGTITAQSGATGTSIRFTLPVAVVEHVPEVEEHVSAHGG
jgi:PAS domain S-box-containing protein